MPKITHPITRAVTEIPDRVVPWWTGPGGWQLVTDTAPTTTPQGKTKRRSRAGTPKTTPAPDAEAKDGDPGLGASTTEPTKE